MTTVIATVAESFQLMDADFAGIDCFGVRIAVELVAGALDYRFDCVMAMRVDSDAATLQEAEIVSKTIQTTFYQSTNISNFVG